MTQEEMIRIQLERGLPEAWSGWIAAHPHVKIRGPYFAFTLMGRIEILGCVDDGVPNIEIFSSSGVAICVKSQRLSVETAR